MSKLYLNSKACYKITKFAGAKDQTVSMEKFLSFYMNCISLECHDH